MKEFLEQLKEEGYAQSSIVAYYHTLKFFEDIGVTKLTINAFAKKVSGFKPNSRQAYLLRLKNYLRCSYPELERLIDLPKLPRCIPQNIPGQEAIYEILQRPDITTYKGVRDRAILEVFYSTGIRKSELINLKLTDIDYSKNVLRVNQGKMKKDRLLPISGKAIEWLKKYLENVRPLLKARHNYIFMNMFGQKLSQQGPYVIIKKYSTNSCHKYRHAYATHLLQNGMKETSLQKLLGHSELSSTQIYTKVTITDIKQSYAKYHPRDSWA